MLIALLLLFAAIYLGFPLLALFTVRASPTPRVEQMTAENTPPAALEYVNSMFGPIVELGFEGAGNYVMTAHQKNITSYLSLFTHRDEQVVAAVHVACGRASGQRPLRSSSVQFTTRFSDDAILVTSNVTTGPVFRRIPPQKGFRFRGETDLARLFRLHRAIVERFGPEQPKRMPEKGGELRALEDQMKEVLEAQTRLRVMRWDPRGQVYRPTLFGAYYMTWRMLFPMKQILASMETSRMQALAQSLLAR
jgi:hypothetical protein